MVAPPPVLKRDRTREEVAAVVERYAPLKARLRVRVLGADADFALLRDELFADPAHTLLYHTHLSHNFTPYPFVPASLVSVPICITIQER